MSVLPALFRRGERMQPLGTARRPVTDAPPAKPAIDWNFAMPSDKPPKRVRLHLTDEAEAEAADFFAHYRDGNCSCHISPPCGSCTHPGNPRNQAEDDSAWVMGFPDQAEGAA